MVAWSDEEGRYGNLFGSRAFTGKLDPAQIPTLRSLDGESLVDAMARAGYEAARAPDARCDPRALHAYIELHIEDKARQPVIAVMTELQQVVLNFVVNAEQAIIESGRLPGRITIRSFDRQERLVLEVEDTGPGIPVENEAKLFQPFFTTRPTGTGLGLAIVQKIVVMHNGRVTLGASAAGGASFNLMLPLASS